MNEKKETENRLMKMKIKFIIRRGIWREKTTQFWLCVCLACLTHSYYMGRVTTFLYIISYVGLRERWRKKNRKRKQQFPKNKNKKETHTQQTKGKVTKSGWAFVWKVFLFFFFSSKYFIFVDLVFPGYERKTKMVNVNFVLDLGYVRLGKGA